MLAASRSKSFQLPAAAATATAAPAVAAAEGRSFATAAAPPSGGGGPLARTSSLERVGRDLTTLSRSSTLTTVETLPKTDESLSHAATMPALFTQAPRPCYGGLWRIGQFFGFLLGVAVLLGLCLGRPIEDYPAANDMLAVTLLCAVFWIFEVIPIYATALIPAVLLPFLGITSSHIVCEAYWNWITMLVLATYLVSLAVEETKAAKRLVLRALLFWGPASPGSLLAAIMLLCFFLSMTINSVAVALLVSPFAVGLALAAEEQERNAASDLESDRSSLSSLGGDDDEPRKRRGGGRIDSQRFGDALLIGVAYATSCGGMATLTGTIAHYFLAGEVNLDKEVTWLSWFEFGAPIALVSLILAYGWLYFRYVRKTTIRGIQKELLEAEMEELTAQVGGFGRDEAMALAIQVLQVLLLMLRPLLASLLGLAEVNDASAACLPAVILFFIPSKVRRGQALLSWSTVHGRLDFGVLLLIGGGLAINSGFNQSGLNIVVGNMVNTIIPMMGPFTTDLVVLVLATLCSQVFSNVGAAATILPLLASSAMEAVLNPLKLLLPATIATSVAFLLPTASPSNIVALAKSADLARPLRIRDFFLNGLPLTIAVCLVGAALSSVLGQLIFGSHSPLPLWACESAPAGNCMFVPVPGWVQGQWVESQACIIDLGPIAAGSLCRIWNGTILPTAGQGEVP